MSVVVVGAGASGLVASLELATRGVPVTLLEEHRSAGSPCHCCGVVSTDYQEKIGVRVPKSVELNELSGFRFTDGSREIVVRSGHTVAKVISRRSFDEHLAELCISRGVDVLMSRRAASIVEPDRPRVTDESGKRYGAEYVILANGVADGLGYQVGLTKNKSFLLPSAQCVAKKRTDPSIASIYMNADVSPDFFGYVVPVDEEHCKIGVASRKVDAVRSLHLIARKEGAEIYGKHVTWGIWTGGPIPRERVGNVIAVGDAAGMTKATTGGGIVFGVLSAKSATDTIFAEVRGGHAAGVRQDVRRHLHSIRRIRQLIDLAGPEVVMEALFTTTTSERLTRYVEGVDFDFHGGLARGFRIIRPSPRLIPLGLKALGHIIEGLFK